MSKKNQKLATLQREFSSHLLKENDLDILKSLPYSQQESLARLNIYRNNVMGNFESVLSSIFEVVKKIVGDKYFDQLVREYILLYPSTSGNLDYYGDSFPKFIKQKTKEHKLLYLEDISELELLYHKSYFAKDAKKTFDIERFQKISPERYKDLSFEIHPSCYLFSSKFPIFSIWKNNIEDLQKKITISDNGEYVLIERADNSSSITKLSEEEFLFLSYIKAKNKLYETYQKIYRKTKKELDIGSLLNKFISSGIFINFKITK
jgi:hypothetical protein